MATAGYVEWEKRGAALKEYRKIQKICDDSTGARPRHIEVEEDLLQQDSNHFEINTVEYRNKNWVLCAGSVYHYVKATDAILKLGMVYPLPIEKIKRFSKNVDELIVVEEQNPLSRHSKAGIKCRGKEL